MGLKIGSPREIYAGEARVAMTPDSATQLQKLGYDCVIESGAGKAAGLSDDAYRAAGVTVVETAAALYETADIIAKVRPPETSEVDRLGPGKTLISFFYPAQSASGIVIYTRGHVAGGEIFRFGLVMTLVAYGTVLLVGLPYWAAVGETLVA